MTFNKQTAHSTPIFAIIFSCLRLMTFVNFCTIKIFRGGGGGRGGVWGGGSSERCLKWSGGGGGH